MLKWKNPKVFFWTGAIIIVFILMMYFDREKVYKEEKPPVPVVQVGNQKLNVGLGTYKWNNKTVEKGISEFIYDLDYEMVHFKDDLSVIFPKEKEPIYLSWGVVEDSTYKVWPIQAFYSHFDPVSVYPGNVTLSLTAYWENGKKAQYIIPFNVDKTISYQTLLSPKEGGYGLYIVNQNEEEATKSDEQLNKLLPDYQHLLYNWNSWGDLETSINQFPELQVETAPAYILFDTDKEIYRTSNFDELKNFLDSKNTAKEKKITGTLEEMTKMYGVLSVNEEYLFTTVPVDDLKVGQKVSIISTRYAENAIYPQQADRIEVIEDSSIKVKKNWLAEKANTYNIVTAGVKKDTVESLKSNLPNVVRIVNEKNLDTTNGENIKTPIYLVVDHKEVVLQTNSYKDVIRYCMDAHLIIESERQQ